MADVFFGHPSLQTGYHTWRWVLKEAPYSLTIARVLGTKAQILRAREGKRQCFSDILWRHWTTSFPGLPPSREKPSERGCLTLGIGPHFQWNIKYSGLNWTWCKIYENFRLRGIEDWVTFCWDHWVNCSQRVPPTKISERERVSVCLFSFRQWMDSFIFWVLIGNIKPRL